MPKPKGEIQGKPVWIPGPLLDKVERLILEYRAKEIQARLQGKEAA